MLDVVANKLLHLEPDLVVTITAPLDRRRPGNDEDRIRLRNLLADARTRVLARWDRGRAHSILGWLDEAAANVEPGGGAHGVVIVATSDMGVAHLLPFPVREAVALGSTPATPSSRRAFGVALATVCSSCPIEQPVCSRRSATTLSRCSSMASC